MSMDDNAASIMTRKIIAVHPSDHIAEIAATLARHNISAAPVVDRIGTLLGIVSEGDLMRPFARSNPERRAWWLNMLAEGEDLAPEFLDYIRQDRRIAADIMVRDLVTATEDTSLATIAALLDAHHIKRVPIMRGTQMVGIVSRADIVRVLARAAPVLV